MCHYPSLNLLLYSRGRDPDLFGSSSPEAGHSLRISVRWRWPRVIDNAIPANSTVSLGFNQSAQTVSLIQLSFVSFDPKQYQRSTELLFTVRGTWSCTRRPDSTATFGSSYLSKNATLSFPTAFKYATVRSQGTEYADVQPNYDCPWCSKFNPGAG